MNTLAFIYTGVFYNLVHVDGMRGPARDVGVGDEARLCGRQISFRGDEEEDEEDWRLQFCAAFQAYFK